MAGQRSHTPWGALTLAGVLLSACAGLGPKTVPGRSTSLMTEVGARRSAVDLRARVDAVIPAMMTAVEVTADRVRDESSDPRIRRRALRFKIDLVPVIYEAGFRADPLAAGLDLWLLSYQIEGCLEAGNGMCDFGPQQPAARTAARQQREALDRLIERISLNRDALEWERQLVRDTARRHPLQNQESLRQRSAITVELSKAIAVDALSPFEVLGDVSTTLTTLSSRLNLYVEEAARLAHWRAELLAEDSVVPSIDRALGDVGRVSASVERLSNTLDTEFMNGLVDRAGDAVRDERKAAMTDVDRQRQLTLQYVSAERKALVDTVVASLMAGVHAERAAVLAELRTERLETLEAIEQVRIRLIADTFAEGRRLIDHLTWRLAQLTTGALVLGALMLWAAGRRPTTR